jgi:mRNA interferase RelE/StbE
VSYSARFSSRAEKDFDGLDRDTRGRIRNRARELEANPYDPRISQRLTDKGGLRKSRVGGWRMIFTVDDETGIVHVVMIERRGQVYKRV